MIQATVYCILSGCAGAIVGITLTIAGIWYWDHGEPLDEIGSSNDDTPT